MAHVRTPYLAVRDRQIEGRSDDWEVPYLRELMHAEAASAEHLAEGLRSLHPNTAPGKGDYFEGRSPQMDHGDEDFVRERG